MDENPSRPDRDPAAADPLELLRHELKIPLTTIRGQAHLLRRHVRRLDGLDGPERAWLLERADRIDAAVLALVARIERIGHELREVPTAEAAPEEMDRG